VEAGEIFLREDGAKDLRLALHRGEAAEAFFTKQSFFIGEGFVGRVAQLGQPLVSTSLETDMRFLRRAVVEAGFRSFACIPLTAHRKVVGVLSVASRQERLFSTRELDLLSAIGTWAGTAIENVRLNRQSRRLAVLEERERIGMDLHDGIIQSVYAVGLALDYARMAIDENPDLAQDKISQAIDGLNDAIHDIRAYILDLRPRQLRGEETLMEGIESLADEFRANTTAEIEITGTNNGLAELPHEHALALFHICREALANVIKHAQSHQANVRLWTTDDRVMLKVTDDGRGFDLRKMSVTLGHGLSNMHRRARKVGGDVEISSIPSVGTTILAWVPCDSQQVDEDN
jgi:signal transduction histidine kinase